MRVLIGLMLTVLTSLPAGASDAALSVLDRWRAEPETVFDAAEVDLNALTWQARAVVVLADSPADPRYVEQLDLLARRPADLVERDVIIIADADPAAKTAIRQALRPRGFMLVLIGKDGGVKLRKPLPWHVREISRSIDKTPLRQQEIRERQSGLQ